MLKIPSLLLVFMLASIGLAVDTRISLPGDTSVVSMLGMIPKCAVACVMHDVFEEGGCEMTTAGALAQCACTNITIQSHLSACVQQSCSFKDQISTTVFAGSLCEAFPKETRVNELKTIAITTIALAVPFLLLRLYSRWLQTSRLWSDDAFAIIAAVFLIAVSAIILRMSLMGFGLHYWNVPAKNGVALLKLFYVCQMLYILVQVFSKVAILVLYSRLFPKSIAWFQWTVRAMVAFMFIHGAVFFLLVTFQCLPVRSIWDKTIPGRCLPVSAAIGFTGAGLSIVEDFIILLLPVRELWKLQMNARKKLGLVVLLSLGSFASVTSIVRLQYVLKYANTYDVTWDNVDVIKWSLIEILSACICGNLMPLRPLIERLLPSVRSVFAFYSRGSQRSTDKKSSRYAQFSWRDPKRKVARKPERISTLNFTTMSLSPNWNRQSSSQSEEWKGGHIGEAIAPVPPLPVHQEGEAKSYGCDVEKRSEKIRAATAQGAIRYPPAPSYTQSRFSPTFSIETQEQGLLNSVQCSSYRSEDFSRGSSEMGLMPPGRGRERRHSGPWSRAFDVVYRR